MKPDVFYLVPSYRGRKDMYLVINKGGNYQLWQNQFGGQKPMFLNDIPDDSILVALALKADLPQ